VPIAFKHRGEVGGADPLYGGLVGAFNIGGNLSTLLALSTLPGAVVFPLVSSGGLLLVMVLSRLIFRERLNRLNLLGVVLTLLAVVLINF
jgi:multidrug transporter EmrE-like cation transporter